MTSSNKTVLLRDRKRRTARAPHLQKFPKCLFNFLSKILSIFCPKLCPFFVPNFVQHFGPNLGGVPLGEDKLKTLPYITSWGSTPRSPPSWGVTPGGAPPVGGYPWGAPPSWVGWGGVPPGHHPHTPYAGGNDISGTHPTFALHNWTIH